MDFRNPFPPHPDRNHPRYIPQYPPPPAPPLPPPRPRFPSLAGEASFCTPYRPRFPPSTIQVPPPMVPPPLPSQLSYRLHPLPPPPLPLNSHHTQFTFLNTSRHPIDDQTLPRGEVRHANHEFENPRPDSWGLSRGSPPFVFSRDFNDRFDCDGYCDNEQFVSNSCRTSRNLRHDHFSPDSKSRKYENLGNYGPPAGSVSGESFRGDGLSDKFRRGRRPGFESAGINENHLGVGFRIDGGEHASLASSPGKRGNRGEGNGEFLHSPWKKPQKKSALLRLQKPAPRNRTDLSALPFDGSLPIPCRGEEEPVVHSDHKLEATREGSPVELDVSFRPNSLVGKAVAVPSDAADICDRNLPQRTRKLRKVTEPKTISSSLQLTKNNSRPVNSSDGFTCVAHATSSPNKELKLSDDRIEIYGKKTISDTDLPLCSTETIAPPPKSMVEASEEHAISDRADSLIDCYGTPLVEYKKLEVEIATLCSAGIRETKKFDESSNTTDSFCSPSAASGSFTDLKHLKEKTTSDGTIMKSEALSQSSLNEDTSKECATVLYMFSDESDTVVDPGQPCLHNGGRQPISNCLLGSSNSKKSSTDEPNGFSGLSIDGSCTISNIDNGSTDPKDSRDSSNIKTVETSTFSGWNDLTMQPGNTNLTRFSEALLSVEGNVDIPVSSSNKISIHKDSVDSYSSGVMDNNNKSLDRSNKKLDTSCVSIIRIADGKQLKSNQIKLSMDDGTVPSRKTSDYLGFPNSSNHSIGASFGFNNSHYPVQQEPIECLPTECLPPGGVAAADIDKLPFSDKVNSSPGNDSKHHGSMKLKVFLKNSLCLGSDKEHAPESWMKTKVSGLQSGMPSSNKVMSNAGLEKPVNSSLGMGGASFPRMDSSLPKEGSTVSGFESPVIGLAPCIGVDAALQGISSIEGFNGSTATVRDDVDDFNESSMKCKIKREAFTGASSHDSFGGCESAHALEIGGGVASNLDGCATQPGDESGVPATPCMLPSSMGMGNCFEETSSMPIVSQGDAFGDECSKLKGLRPDMCSVSKSPFLSSHSDFSSGLVTEQKENALHDKIEYQNDIMGVDKENEYSSTSEPQISDLPPGTVAGCDSPEKDGSSHVCNLVDLCPHGHEASNTKCDSRLIVLSPNELCNTDSSKNLSADADRLVLNSCQPWGEISFNDNCGNEAEFDDKAEPNDYLTVPFSSSLSHNPNASFFHATKDDHLSPPESVELLSKDLKELARELKKAGVPHRQNRQLPRGHLSCSPHAFNSSKTSVSSNSTRKPHTWHRIANQSGVSRGTSYVRKGNSLVRKSASFTKNICGLSSSAHLLSTPSKNEMRTSEVTHDRVDMMGPPNCSTVELSASLERPAACSMQHSSKPSNCNPTTSGKDISSPQESPPLEECSENLSHISKVAETKDPSTSSKDPLTPLISENHINLSSNSKDDGAVNEVKMSSRGMKNIMYVKGKPNQLVAASNSSDTSVHDVDKIRASANDYYKRKRNQLIRTSLKNQSGPAALVPGESSISEEQRGLIVPRKSFSRKRLESVKNNKPSKFSLASVSPRLLKKAAFPAQLFTSKRATRLRGSLHNSANNRSSSMIGRKLLLPRKRGAVYTRSLHGFSLWKSKILSIGGSNLKWSKSFEKRSKNANEEAKKAVAEVEMSERRPDDTNCVTSRADRNHSSRERTFRIGLDRYKMDSSGRTLQRIADEKSFSTTIQPGNNLKKSYVPRRLLVGKDEYIQIGNGNQLIRDPKKRTRILASEKVRWSLRTARLRSAKRQKYCQFYTRFGHCNKDGGKCQYIHDPSKIVVCTKFLRGLCSNLYCRLTHQIIPERMQDCSYFVQGLCTNEKCPYRHVNVNPSAPICEGFLKGYCADGNECRKKHSYVCPDYVTTGSCPQGLKCKLHHPKKKSRGRKRKRAEGTNANCRYFGAVPEPKSGMSERQCTVNGYDDGDDIFLKDGSFADYVRLDVCDEEPEGDYICLDDQTVAVDDDDEPTIGVQLDDPDLDPEKVVKPFRIMD